MTDKQPEALIRADELEAIGAESSLARAMAAHTIRLLHKENSRLREVNAELVEALSDIEKNYPSLWAGKRARDALAKAQGDNNANR